MSSQVFPLNDSKHRHLRVKQDECYAHAQYQHLVPIMVDEVLDAVTEYPVVFVKNAQTGSFTLCVLMGLSPQENLYCGRRSFTGMYIPRALRLYPFFLREQATSLHAEVCLFEDNDLLNQQEGEPLYTADGKQSEFLVQQVARLTAHQEQKQQTESFIQLLLAQDLLQEQTIRITLNGQAKSFDGVYVPNQHTLQQLAADKFLALRDNGGLAILYALQNSLKQLNRLMVRYQAEHG